MTEYVPIKIKIGTRGNGQADHPDFNVLPIVQTSGMDWSKWVDVFGSGWVYDKKCGHKEADATSPRGMQWGVLLVPELFADQALDAFPTLVTEITEVECETFWNERAHAHMPTEDIDSRAIEILEAQMRHELDNLRKATLQTRIDKAMDPNDPEPGLRRNRRKRFADWKINTDATVKVRATVRRHPIEV